MFEKFIPQTKQIFNQIVFCIDVYLESRGGIEGVQVVSAYKKMIQVCILLSWNSSPWS